MCVYCLIRSRRGGTNLFMFNVQNKLVWLKVINFPASGDELIVLSKTLTRGQIRVLCLLFSMEDDDRILNASFRGVLSCVCLNFIANYKRKIEKKIIGKKISSSIWDWKEREREKKKLSLKIGAQADSGTNSRPSHFFAVMFNHQNKMNIFFSLATFIFNKFHLANFS